MDTLPGRPRLLTRADAALAFGLLAATFAVYRVTLTPSLSYLSPDGNELATVPYVLGLAHSPGYPLYTWLGWLFTRLPFGDVAHRINLMSAISGAMAAAGLYLIAARLLPASGWRRPAAALAALLFALAPTTWSQAVIAEVYAPNLAWIAFTLLALLHWEHTRRDRDFLLFSLTFGLSLGMHISDLGFAPAFGLFCLLTDRAAMRRPRWWLAGAAGFGLGLAQFAWLPLRAETLSDRMMLARAPITLQGIYSYTLGAFPQLKFAFPLAALPDRLVVYLDLLRQEFGPVGIAAGIIGLASLLFRRTRHYYLLVGMYLVHIWFFIQYSAFDLEVFFLPAHFLWAIFIAFGLTEFIPAARALAVGLRIGLPSARVSSPIGLALVALVSLYPILVNGREADHSADVAVDDFYANTWEILPPDCALLTQSGVFGYDAFYWRMVYDTRPDVLLPALPGPSPSPEILVAREIFSTTPDPGSSQARGPGALPANLVPADFWQVPVLFGARSDAAVAGRGRLVLYRLSPGPPDLVRDWAAPSLPIDATMGSLTLLGADIGSSSVESGGRLHIVLYWRGVQPTRVSVATSLGSLTLEAHSLGLGLLDQWQAEFGPVGGNEVLVEDYWVVIPSTTLPGRQTLAVSTDAGRGMAQVRTIEVLNEEEALERWLNAAGSSPPGQ
jgi:hypothetical protein